MLFNRVALGIQAVTVEKLAPDQSKIGTDASLFSPSLHLKIDNWLPYLSLGPLGRADDTSIIAQTGSSDFVAFGPYWPLPVGHYEMTIKLERDSGLSLGDHLIRVDVVSGDEQLVAGNFHLDPERSATTVRLPFEISGNSSELRQIETRTWSSGEERFRIRSLSVMPFEQSGQQDLLPFLLIGKFGRRVDTGIGNVAGRTGS